MVLGQGRIGTNTCVGSAATLINPALAADQVIAPGSLTGDTSRAFTDTPIAAQSLGHSSVESPQTGNPQAGGSQSESSQAEGSQSESSPSESSQVGSSPSESPQANPQSHSPVVSPAKTNPGPNQPPLGQTDSEQSGVSATAAEKTDSEQSGVSATAAEETDSEQSGVSATAAEETDSEQNGASAPAPGQSTNFSQVYGRRQIDQLLVALFPHRQPLNSPFPPDSS